jgi:hypothetical protein
LHALRISLANGLGELPAVLALDPAEQTDEVGAGALPGLRAAEAVAYPPMHFSKRPRPFADGRRPDDPVLRDHNTPFLVLPEGLLRRDLTDAVGTVFEQYAGASCSGPIHRSLWKVDTPKCAFLLSDSSQIHRYLLK